LVLCTLYFDNFLPPGRLRLVPSTSIVFPIVLVELGLQFGK
jgi:hypothetical protein